MDGLRRSLRVGWNVLGRAEVAVVVTFYGGGSWSSSSVTGDCSYGSGSVSNSKGREISCGFGGGGNW